jgi:hypothetical protein
MAKYVLLLVLVALIALAVGMVFRHPIPAPLTPSDPVEICGQPLHLPLEVGYVDGLLDGGTMIFAAKDAAGKVYGFVCQYGRGADRFRLLSFSVGVPVYDGTTNPTLTAIIANEPLVRNLLYHSMAAAGFHGSRTEKAMAQQLYPSVFERYRD